MLLATIIILFSLLALGLLAMLDRFDGAALKAHITRHSESTGKIQYYDAFSDRRDHRDSPGSAHLETNKRDVAA